MGHPRDLLELVAKTVRETYPEGPFSYSFEEFIPGEDRRRFSPDIIVRDQAGCICCLVEIGYTRPEKLTFYRQKMKIGDVRWYDKQGRLHGDVDQRTVITRHKVAYDGLESIEFMTLPLTDIACLECAASSVDEETDWLDACVENSLNVDAYMIFNQERFSVVYACDECGGSGIYGLDALEEMLACAPDCFDAAHHDWCAHRRGQGVSIPMNGYLVLDTAKKTYSEIVAALSERNIDLDYGHFQRFPAR